MPSQAYLLSLPERAIRSALGFTAGLLREIGEVALPRTVRRGQLYKSLVDTTLRYVIEQVGGAKGVFRDEVPQAQDFLRRWRDCSAQTSRCGLGMKCLLFHERISLPVQILGMHRNLKRDAAVNINSSPQDPVLLRETA